MKEQVQLDFVDEPIPESKERKFSETYIKEHILIPAGAAHGVLIERIETGSQNPGFPDCTFTSPQGNGYIEVKKAKINRGAKKLYVHYEPLQQGKLTRLLCYTELAYVLIYHDEMYYLTQVLSDYFTDEEEMRSTALWTGRKLNAEFFSILTGSRLLG